MNRCSKIQVESHAKPAANNGGSKHRRAHSEIELSRGKRGRARRFATITAEAPPIAAATAPAGVESFQVADTRESDQPKLRIRVLNVGTAGCLAGSVVIVWGVR